MHMRYTEILNTPRLFVIATLNQTFNFLLILVIEFYFNVAICSLSCKLSFATCLNSQSTFLIKLK